MTAATIQSSRTGSGRGIVTVTLVGARSESGRDWWHEVAT